MATSETRRGRTIWELMGRQEFESLRPTRWWVITGGPGTGKTSTLEHLDRRGYRVMPEAARVFIDDRMKEGMTRTQARWNELAFQDSVMYMKQKIENDLPEDELILFDRGIHDTFAYNEIAEAEARRINPNRDVHETIWIPQRYYRGVFILDPLNSYDGEDYARVEDSDKAARIHERIRAYYEWFGFHPIRVPVFSSNRMVSIQRRAQFMIDHIRSADSTVRDLPVPDTDPIQPELSV